MTRVAVATIAFLVVWAVFTTVFAASANKPEVRLLPKWLWVTLCAVVPFFGGLLYLMVGRPLGRAPGGLGGKGKVIAPDDDPNFLRDISKKLKQDEPEEPKDTKDRGASDDEGDKDDKKDGEK
ncbi:MAG TPA: PLD nuclease N-terminal domain-containing protein [Aquiluna sp.]